MDSLIFSSKEDFLEYCNGLFDHFTKKGFVLVSTPNEPCTITYVKKRKALKYKVDVLVADGMFQKKETISPLIDSCVISFIAIDKKELIEEFRGEKK